MTRTTLSCSLVLAVACAGCGDGSPPAEAPTPAPSGYHVTGGFLRDPQGRALRLRGMSLGGQKVAPYLDFETLPDYQRVRDAWGMNVVRFRGLRQRRRRRRAALDLRRGELQNVRPQPHEVVPEQPQPGGHRLLGPLLED